MAKSKQLSLRSLRAAAKRAKKGEPGLDAMWASAGWLIPAQGLALTLAGVGFWLAGGISIGIAVGLAIASPFIAGAIQAGLDKDPADRSAWLFMMAVAGWTWFSVAGALPAAVLAGVGVGLFLRFHRRYRTKASRAAYDGVLPDELGEELASLPKKLPKQVRTKVDAALAALQSLDALREGIPDAEDLKSDALACMRQVMNRAQTLLRLEGLTLDTLEIERTKDEVERQLSELVAGMEAAVNAAARYAALDEASAREELAEHAASLRALTEGMLEVEAALEST